MNKVMGISPVMKIVIALLLLMISGFIYGGIKATHESTSNHHAAHEAQQDDDSVVAIIDSENVLHTNKLSDISGPVINSVYAKHYERTGKIERTARYNGGLKSLGDDKYAFSVTFLPSGTTYAVELAVANLETKQFTVEVK